MPINNKALYDAVLSGSCISNDAWLFDTVSADYSGERDAAIAIATEVDSLIPTIAIGVSTSERILMEAIVRSVFAARRATDIIAGDYSDIAAAIVAAFWEMDGALQDTTGGAGSNLVLTKMLYVDQATLCPIGQQNGNIESPFASILAAIAAATAGTMIYVMPYDYSTEGDLNIGVNLAIATNIFVEQEDVSATVPFATYGNIIAAAGITCQIVGAEVNDVTGTITSVIMLNQVDALNVLGYPTLELETSTISAAGTCQVLTLKSMKSVLPGSVVFALDNTIPAANVCQIRQSKLVSTTITFDVTATNGLVQIDNDSLHAAGYAGLIDIINGSIKVIDDMVFSNTLFVDIGSTDVVAGQDGSIVNPYSTITAAIGKAVATDIIQIIPGIYNPESDINVTKDLSLVGFGGFVATAGLNLSAGVILYTTNVICNNGLGSGIINVPATSSIRMKGRGRGNTIFYNNGITGDGGVTLTDGLGVGNIACSQFIGENCEIVGSITLSGTTCTFSGGTFFGAPVITFTGAPGTLVLNDGSYEQFIRAGGTVVHGIITRNDAELPLSNTLYVDIGTRCPADCQDGGINNPFSTLTAGITASGGIGVLICTPDAYNGEGVIAATKSLTIQPTSGTMFIAGITVTAAMGVVTRYVIYGGVITVPATAAIEIENGMFINGIAGDGFITLRNTNCAGGILANRFTAFDCIIDGNIGISSGSAIINGGQFSTPIITFAAPGGILYLNSDAYLAFLRAGGTVVNGTIVRNDAEYPLSDTMYVDNGTVIPTATQNGSITSPFKTITQAVTVLSAGGIIYITPGDYSTEAPIASALPFTFINLDSECDISGTSVVELPTITNTDNITLKGCICKPPAAANSTTDELIVDNCSIGNWTVGELKALRSIFNGSVTLNDPTSTYEIHNSIVDTVVWMTLDPAATGIITDTVISSDHHVTSIVFTAPGGVIKMDAFTYGQWIDNGATITNGTIEVIDIIPKLRADLDGNGKAIWNFRNGGSSVNLAVGAGLTVAFPAYVIPDLAHAVKTYCATFGFRCGMYNDALHTNNGEMDFQVGMSIVTDIAGVATVTLDTVPVPNVSYLPAALAGATFTVAPTAGGFTVSVTAPGALACHAWYDFWLQRYRDVT